MRDGLNRAFMNPISLSLVRMQMPTHKPTVQALGGSYPMYPYFIFFVSSIKKDSIKLLYYSLNITNQIPFTVI